MNSFIPLLFKRKSYSYDLHLHLYAVRRRRHRERKRYACACVVSFRLFRSRRSSVSLGALLIFLPLYHVRSDVCIRMYAFASLRALCVCQLLILYKHAHTRVRPRTQTLMGRRVYRRGGWKEKINSCIDGCSNAFCSICDCWGVKVLSHFVPFGDRRHVE